MRVCISEHIHMVNECLIDMFKEGQCVWEIERSRGKGCSLCVCVFKRKRSVIRVVAIHSFFECVCVCVSQMREKKRYLGVIVSRRRCVCVCEGVNSSSVWTVHAGQGSSTSDEHFTRSLRHPFFLLPLFSMSQ